MPSRRKNENFSSCARSIGAHPDLERSNALATTTTTSGSHHEAWLIATITGPGCASNDPISAIDPGVMRTALKLFLNSRRVYQLNPATTRGE